MVVLFLLIHLAASVLLAAFGLHRLVLAARYLRRVRSRPPCQVPARLPPVTVQIPLYNERYVAERAIRAAARLDYPRALLEIQVLDDSTDETTAAVASVVDDLAAEGVCIRHVRRPSRLGYKAGALAHGLTTARGRLIAVFDADFVPPSDFLLRTVGEFIDPGVGMVQARWEHLNRSTSLLTRIQALQLDAHFAVEHGVRAATGCFFNFNGTAGIWRREAIESAGGWSADTLTEDLDLSYRAQLAGWRFVYRDDVAVPAELPVEVAAYRVQQQRWAQGGIQTARKILPAVMRSRYPAAVKREAVWHLTGHVAYPLLVLLAVAGLCVTWLADAVPRAWVAAADGTLLAFATAALSVFYGVAAAVRSPRSLGRRLLLVPAVMILGAGIALSQTAAVWRGLARRSVPFHRTPKYRLGRVRSGRWRASAYRVGLPREAVAELAVGIVFLGTTALQLASGVGLPTGMSLLLGLGFVIVGGGIVAQTWGPPRAGGSLTAT